MHSRIGNVPSLKQNGKKYARLGNFPILIQPHKSDGPQYYNEYDEYGEEKEIVWTYKGERIRRLIQDRLDMKITNKQILCLGSGNEDYINAEIGSFKETEEPVVLQIYLPIVVYGVLSEYPKQTNGFAEWFRQITDCIKVK